MRTACRAAQQARRSQGLRASTGFGRAPHVPDLGQVVTLQRSDKPLGSLLFLKIVHGLKTSGVLSSSPQLRRKISDDFGAMAEVSVF